MQEFVIQIMEQWGYLGVALFTYALTLRVDRLEAQEDYQKQNQAMVLRTQ